MASPLRILTYNTQLRSWMMEVGWPPSIPPVDTAEMRAMHIASKILASPQDYDIVCLQEVFDEDARDVLSEELRAKYRYQVAKADLKYIRLVRPGLVHNLENLIFGLTFGPLLDVTSSLLELKWEDSGLFLASKWPFAHVPVPTEVSDLLPSSGSIFPLGVPVVSFLTYEHCSGGDCRAAKGVLHARIQRSVRESYDLFVTHTQADDNKVDENRAPRDLQFGKVWNFVRSRTDGPPFDRPVFFMGDFNVLGGAKENASRPAQWEALFNTPGSPFTDYLTDLWGAHQCLGVVSGLDDAGFTADVSYEPYRQRLDYVVAMTGNLASQHLKVDYALAQPPMPLIPGVSFLSDHLPLSIELAEPHPHCTPPLAKLVTAVDFYDRQGLDADQVMWYHYNQKGTYEFDINGTGHNVYFEVYLGNDLSRPRKQYRDEKDPERGVRFVLVAPFFIKIANRDREKFGFEFRSHRHEGRDPADPINLIPGIPYPESFPHLQPLNGDSSFTSWPDPDTKWFLLDVPRVAVDAPIRLRAVAEIRTGDKPISLLVARWKAPDRPELVGQTPKDVGPHHLEWEAERGERFFVCVRRHDTGFAGLQFTVSANTDLTLLRGGDRGPRLVCNEETSGWGADDIALELKADANGWSRTISNDEIGDFETDSVRDLRQWIPESIPYQTGFTVKVIEEDDIDDDDMGQETLPGYGSISSWGRWTLINADPEGNLEGAVKVEFDGGRYTFRCFVSRWDETL